MVDGESGLLAQFRLDGRQALVTGAAHGIGYAAAVALAEAGADVCLTDIDGVRARAAACALAGRGLRATAGSLDVTDEQAAGAAVDAIVATAGRPGHPGKHCRHGGAGAGGDL